MNILIRLFCTVMVSIALSAAEMGSYRRFRSPQPIVLTEPPPLSYPPRAILWKPRYR